MYTVILYAHIMSAALSIGPFFVLLPMIKHIKKADQQSLPVLLTAFRSATRIVMHAGHILVATGMLMIWQGPWAWNSP